jgi:hypothetical protein
MASCDSAHRIQVSCFSAIAIKARPGRAWRNTPTEGTAELPRQAGVDELLGPYREREGGGTANHGALPTQTKQSADTEIKPLKAAHP